MASGNNIEHLRVERGWSRPQLGERMGTSGQQVERLEKGQRKLTHEWMEKAAEAFGVDTADIIGAPRSLVAKTQAVAAIGYGNRAPDQPVTRTVDGGETVSILRLDLSYSMGPGTSLDDSYIESEPIKFDLGFLRTITITPPDRIRIVDGIGDSMQPTIHDRDLLFIDTNQRDLNAQDRIWALWLFGLGAVKRLRAVGPDRVLVISDNPDIENQEVSRKDIMIHGRVVGSIKRI